MYEANHIPGVKIVNEGTSIVNHANNAAMIINNTMPMFSIIADGLYAAMRSCTITATVSVCVGDRCSLTALSSRASWAFGTYKHGRTNFNLECGVRGGRNHRQPQATTEDW
jgi:hypothetical protein